MSQFKPKRVGRLGPWVGELGRNPHADVAAREGEMVDTGLVFENGAPVLRWEGTVWNRAARRKRWKLVKAAVADQLKEMER